MTRKEEINQAAVEAFKQIVDSDKNNFLEIFKAGAQWQKQQDSIPSKDLAELIDTLSKRYPEVSFAKLSRIAVRVAKWQKEQTLDKATNWLDANIEQYISADGEWNLDWHITDDLEKYLKE